MTSEELYTLLIEQAEIIEKQGELIKELTERLAMHEETEAAI